MEHLTHKHDVLAPGRDQRLGALPPRQVPGQNGGSLRIQDLLCIDLSGRSVGRVKGHESVLLHLGDAQLQRLRLGLEGVEVKGAGRDGILDAHAVVEVDDRGDGRRGLLLLQDALGKALIGLGILLGGDVGGLLEGVAVEGDARVRLRVTVVFGGEVLDGLVDNALCFRELGGISGYDA